MTHVDSKLKLRPVVRSSMHPCPGHWMAIGRAVVNSARATHALSAGIRYRHCGSFTEPEHPSYRDDTEILDQPLKK